MPLKISGTNGFSVDGTNWAMMPNSYGGFSNANMPYCAVQRTGGGGWSAAVTPAATMVFNSVYQNVGGYYNTSTGLFTCPKTARYRMDFSFLGGNNNGNCHLYAAKNGVVQSYSFHINTTTIGGYINIQGFWMGICNSGDTLSMMYVTTASALYLDGHNNMTIVMLD